ncbi:Mov34/MPN/PAD-1 family protein [Spirochaeta thermophila]|uniref:Mov34/MPN/PAD-1 family protein n=1 Tax=Winmispira thermophila (strain ATCC 49972 / DSM 6192 / RI 19.B1) TaxID=665571 RepID=E0RN93_WINT6|nr:M67 family metallopeptidase [Spirochaeta thermophila]ADN02562.1 Mov34/MPN/PAD-1 family protein [Spirochaeta thermophila DSM 6192]
MKMPASLIEEIARHAREEAPIEACGYVAGVGDEARKIFRLTNADASPEHFSFIPEEQFATLKAARKEGLSLIGVYHSHPATPARMSEEDIRLANDTEMRYLIYSVAEGVLRCFRVDEEKRVTEEPIEVTGGGP